MLKRLTPMLYPLLMFSVPMKVFGVVSELAPSQQLPLSLSHLAGYAAVGYTDRESRNGSFQVFNFSPIFHYLYNDKVMLESELEIGYAPDGSTETNLEYAALDFFINDYVMLIGGQFSSPIGYMRQNLHPAWINKFPSLPPGFSDGGAAPISATGLQLRGGFLSVIGSGNYSIFVSNPPQLIDGDGELEVETEGVNQASNNHKTVGGRIGFLPLSNLEIGVSAAIGKANVMNEDKRDYSVYDVDISYQPASLVEVRGEYVKTEIGSLSTSIFPESHAWEAWYVQASHKFLSVKLEPVLRYGNFTPPDSEGRLEQWAAGVNYLVTNNAMVKMAYELNQGESGTENDKNRFLLQLAYGF